MGNIEFSFIDSNEIKSEKTQEEKFERVIRYLKKIGYFELIKDDKKFEEFFQSLNFDQFKRIVFAFNSLLKNKHTHEKGVSENVVRVGSIMGVRPELREELFENVFNSLKKLDNNQDRAMLLYYQLLRLHMFSDGNGRTSRFFYELFNKQGDFESINKYFIHKDDSQSSTTSYNKRDESFDSVNGFLDERLLSEKLGGSIFKFFEKYVKEVPECLKDKRVNALECDDDFRNNCNISEVNKIFDSCMSPDEKKVFKNYLNDCKVGKITLAAAVIAIININKGNLDYIIEQDKKGYSNPNAFVFNIANPDTFHNWNREDFLEAIRLGDEIKKHNINLLNDIFVNDVEINGFSKQDIYLDRKKELDDMLESKDITITNNSQKK